jgi:microcystin-dependent protein
MSTSSQPPQKNTKLNVLYTDNTEGTIKSTCLIPPGTIVMWVGSEVPYGWALCNGQNGTPNLIDKFIKGGKYPRPLIPSSSPGSLVAGYTGGNKMITLTQDNLPSHKHSLYFSESSTEPDHNHTNIKTEAEKTRTTIKHKHSYNVNNATVELDDSSSSSNSTDMYKTNTNTNTSVHSHSHILEFGHGQSHNHTCNIKFNSRSIPPESKPYPSETPSPSGTPSPTNSNFVYIPKPPHTNLIPSISSQEVFSPQPINIEPSYYVLAFIMKL